MKLNPKTQGQQTRTVHVTLYCPGHRDGTSSLHRVRRCTGCRTKRVRTHAPQI